MTAYYIQVTCIMVSEKESVTPLYREENWDWEDKYFP